MPLLSFIRRQGWLPSMPVIVTSPTVSGAVRLPSAKLIPSPTGQFCGLFSKSNVLLTSAALAALGSAKSTMSTHNKVEIFFMLIMHYKLCFELARLQSAATQELLIM